VAQADYKLKYSFPLDKIQTRFHNEQSVKKHPKIKGANEARLISYGIKRRQSPNINISYDYINAKFIYKDTDLA
jgi:hypothetical protein